MFGRRLPKASATASVVTAALLLPAGAGAQEEAAAEATGVSVTAKPGKGVTFEQKGDYKLNLRGRFQALAVFAENDDEIATEGYIRRARLNLEGYVFNEDLEYKFELAFAPRDLDESGSPVLDAYLNLAHVRDANLKVGLFKTPFDRQRVTSSGNLQFVDRSPLLAETTLDRDFGISVHSEDLFGLDGRLGYALGLFTGEGRGRLEAPAGFLYTARLEYRPFGAFDDYSEADLTRSSRPRLAIAGSVGWNEDAVRTNSNRGSALGDEFGGFDYLHLATDAMFKWNGLSLLGEMIWRDARDEDPVVLGEELLAPRNTWGWFVQGGQMLTDEFEVVARYTEQHALSGDNSSALLEDLAGEGREVGAGLNWYVQGHSLKLQADYFRTWGDDLEQGAVQLAGTEFADGANQVRVQLQAAF